MTPPPSPTTAELAARRAEMVETQLRRRNITSSAVLEAMGRVSREAFIPADLRHAAYRDSPLPIAEQQTISQPYIVAYMLEALGLTGGERVLEVGTGSGYGAAVLAEIAAEVYTVERHRSLADRARTIIAQLGYSNVEVLWADGTKGWPGAAPYGGIVVTAAGAAVPDDLKTQLAIGGRLVIPVGTALFQTLMCITRLDRDHYREESLCGVRFVPLIGDLAR
ncbi:MAG: protein-L-isoaspartate(D-aspartate) O-methyltransferase [Candidatus Competibacterales bacterium]